MTFVLDTTDSTYCCNFIKTLKDQMMKLFQIFLKKTALQINMTFTKCTAIKPHPGLDISNNNVNTILLIVCARKIQGYVTFQLFFREMLHILVFFLHTYIGQGKYKDM